MKLKYLLVLLLFVLLVAGCGTDQTRQTEPAESPSASSSASAGSLVETVPNTEPSVPKNAVTLMIYMTGSDLESSSAAATKDLQEIVDSGADASCVNVLVYTGGATQWYNGIPADQNVLLRLTEDGFVQEKTFELLSMGEPECLLRFLNYAWEHYPADTFDLILWDHGNGPLIGYGKDKAHGNDSMTLEELDWRYGFSLFGDVAANSKGYSGIRLTFPKEDPNPVISFKFRIYTMGGGKLLYESDKVIELPVPENKD